MPRWLRIALGVSAAVMSLVALLAVGAYLVLRSMHETATENAVGTIEDHARQDGAELVDYLTIEARKGSPSDEVLDRFATTHGRTVDVGQRGDSLYWDVAFYEEGHERGPFVFSGSTVRVIACVRLAAPIEEDPVVALSDCQLPADYTAPLDPNAPVVTVFD